MVCKLPDIVRKTAAVLLRKASADRYSTKPENAQNGHHKDVRVRQSFDAPNEGGLGSGWYKLNFAPDLQYYRVFFLFLLSHLICCVSAACFVARQLLLV